MDNDVNEKYYFFCDESGNDAEHPVVGCVIVEASKFKELLSEIKPKYLEHEKYDAKFEEIHFANFKDTLSTIQLTLNVIGCVYTNVRFYSLILNEKIDTISKKDQYYNILIKQVIKEFAINEYQIKNIFIDKYTKDGKREIGKFDVNFIDSKHKISQLDFSYFIQICDVLAGCIRYKKNKKSFNSRQDDFCDNVKTLLKLPKLISIDENWIVKEYKKK